MNKSILGITAHIDDNVMFAGTVMKLQNKGYEYYEVVLTDNTGGSSIKLNKTGDKMAEIRKLEMKKAAEILKIKKIYWFEQELGELNYSKALMMSLVKIIRKVKPLIGFTINSQDVHRDHIAASVLAKESFRLAAKDSHLELGVPFRTQMVLFSEGTIPIAPSFLVDISKYYDKKEELFKTYASQALPSDISLMKSFAQIRGFHLRKATSSFAEAFSVEQNILPILFED